jgi:hypothetical protein
MIGHVAFAIPLFVHGFAHLVGFVVSWLIATRSGSSESGRWACFGCWQASHLPFLVSV